MDKDNGFMDFRYSSNLISDAPDNNMNNPPLGFECIASDIPLGLNSHGMGNLFSSSSVGSKRELNNMHEKDFLSLGLGLQFSSATDYTTISSAKETTNKESCIHSGLDFQLHLGNNENVFSPKDYHPVPDLNLSLSIGPSESVITSITSPTFPITIHAEPSTTAESGEKSTNHTRSTNIKTCIFQGCTKGARGASLLCIAHGGGRRCQKHGCNKGAEGTTVFCKAHGGGRRCQFLGCTKSAEGRTDHCIAHGGGRRCTHSGCTRAARGKSGLCIRHGGGKRCRMEMCTRSAEGYSGLCISHGGGRRCQYPDCPKGAQGSTMYCKAHGGGKRCAALGCTKGAEGSTPFCKGHGGGKRCAFEGDGKCPKSVHGGTMFCVRHGGGKRCAASECTKSARGKTDYCVRHGGGKRCKFEGCGKSAQGSTDFCKAHGGGKRCSWGGGGCDRIARGRTGMCAAHGGLVQDVCVHGGNVISMGTVEKMKDAAAVEGDVNSVSIPEGRVHGGSFLAFLTKDANAGSSLYGGRDRRM